jgi:type IV secretion system protein VirB10
LPDVSRILARSNHAAQPRGPASLLSYRSSLLSRYEIGADLEILNVLELPGELQAHFTSNVHDTATGMYLLIPQELRLIGQYDSHVFYVQEGVQVTWGRVVFPDASAIDFNGMVGLDAHRNAELRDKVDGHYRRVLGFSVLTSMFTAALACSEAKVSRQVAANAVGQGLAQTGAQITRRNLNVQPTIKVPARYKSTVRVNRDILFEARYEPLAVGPIPQ